MATLKDFTPEQIAEGTRVAEAATAIVAQVLPILGAADSKVVGAALAELLGVFLASFPEEARPETMARLINLSVQYTRMYAAQRAIFEEQRVRPN